MKYEHDSHKIKIKIKTWQQNYYLKILFYILFEMYKHIHKLTKHNIKMSLIFRLAAI